VTPPDGQLVAAADVKLDGQALAPDVADNVLEIRVDLQARLPDRCVIRLADPDLALVSRDSFPLGGALEVSLAGAGATSPVAVFKGVIASLSPHFDRREALLVLHAYDRAHALTRTRRTDTYQQVGYDDVARKVAGRNGLTAGTVESAGGTVPFVQQSNETDWEFLWRLADEVGFEVKVNDRKLHFRKAGAVAGGTPTTLAWGDALLEFRPHVTGVQQVETVEVHGWDPKTSEPIVATATPEAAAEIGITRSDASDAMGGGTVIIADRPVQTAAQASSLADSVAGQIGDAFAEADGVATGDPALVPGGKVKIDGVGTRFGGTYPLASVTHVVRTGRGFESRFAISARSSRSLLDVANSATPPPWAHGVVVGLVTNNNDPEAIGRVRVKYPALGEGHEGWWARVTAPAAGTKRGLLMVPQAGDEVLVAFEHGDTEHPYVLGSVWNGKAKPEELVHADGSFAMRSDKQIAMEAAEAIKVEGDKELTLSSAGAAKLTTSDRSGDGPPGDVTVDAKGAATVKSGTALTIDGGTEVKVTGKTAVNLSAGSSEVKLEAATLTIQGAMVKISGSAMVEVSAPMIKLG
jgi:uncharacterized protein involved in type VI secretion and phage assembly